MDKVEDGTTEDVDQDRGAAQNTDRHLWPILPLHHDADKLHATADGGIGINVGGHVIVMPMRRWFCCALACDQDSVPSVFEEITSLRSELARKEAALQDHASKCEQIADLVELHDSGALGESAFRLAVAKIVRQADLDSSSSSDRPSAPKADVGGEA